MNGNRLKNERWREIERIFDAALEVDVDARAAFLTHACNGDAALRQEVESLLASYCEAGDFLASPADKATAVKLAAALRQKQNGHTNGADTAVTDERFGSYQLIRELAEGGMGTVWLARRADDQFQQQVAIKLLKAGATSEDLLHRFRHERQILASLNHPNIARLLDGGTTTDGRPYIVMEYIEGLPIDEYCRQHQLSIRERLTLFRQVCAAVHYAHQNLLVHRDLKPGNILVTADGAPKLLDFGIAKLLQPDLTKSYDTASGLNPMTPAYASPEQVRGEKLTTASDVYSLGVVLYELLTGHSPYRLQANTFGELVKAVCEQEPLKPSTAVTQSHPSNDEVPFPSIRNPHSAIHNLKGDVDSIVLMALRKEPQARYGSVEQFSEDIRRYLDGLPTVARKGTFGYRAAKYLRRNRIPVAAAALIFLTLLVGIGATWRQARIAIAAQHNAEAQQTKAEIQRQRTEDALVTAKEGRRQAEAARSEADQQRAEAIAQRELANEQRAFADSQRLRAEAQELSNRRLLYTSRIGLAQQAWENANVGRLRDLLDLYLPQNDAPEFRSFEWYYFWRLSHSELKTLPHSGRVIGIAFTPDNNRMVSLATTGNVPMAVTEVNIWDVPTWRLSRSLRFSAPTALALSQDAATLAVSEGSAEIKLVSLQTGNVPFSITKLPSAPSRLALSTDGNRLAACFGNGIISIYETATGQERLSFKAHPAAIYAISFSSDGQRLVSAGHNAEIKLWEVKTGKEIATLKRGGWVAFSVAFSPDGRIVVAAGSGLLKAWEVASGKEVAYLEDVGQTIAFSPDSRQLTTAGNGGEPTTIRLWNTTTWKETNAIKGHGNEIAVVSFTPNGKLLASGSSDQTLRVWEIGKADEVTLIDDRSRGWGEYQQVALTPDGKKLLAAQGNHSFTVWDAATGKELMTLRGHIRPANASGARFHVASSNDGKLFASGGRDALVKLWDARTGQELMTFNAGAMVTALQFSPDDKLLTAGCFDKVRVWEASSGRELAVLMGHQSFVNSIVFLPQGRNCLTASTDGTVRQWEVATGKLLRVFQCSSARIVALALAPGGRVFATGGNDGTARVWELDTGKELLVFNGHSSAVSAVAFSPDGKRLVTGSWDKTVRLWDLSTGQELLTMKDYADQIARNSVGFSPDGKVLFVGSIDRRIRLLRAVAERDVLAQRY